MAFFQGLKDFASGLTRGFSLFFSERHDFVGATTLPGLSKETVK